MAIDLIEGRACLVERSKSAVEYSMNLARRQLLNNPKVLFGQ